MPVDTAGPFPLREVDGDACQFCGSSLLGKPIPDESRHHFGASTHFRREIGVETSDYDGIMFYVCPDCHGAWPRFTGPDRLATLATQAVQDHTGKVAQLADHDRVAAVIAEHTDTIAFMFAFTGFRWTHWVVDPKTGAHLHLLCEPPSSSREADWKALHNAAALVREATALPIFVTLTTAPAVAENLLPKARPVVIGQP